MPVVPAAGYPTGPEAPPAVPLDVPGGDYQHIQATPEAFGAQVGQSMSALGRVLTTSADEFAQVARERQDLHNNVVTDNQINNWTDAAEKRFTGDPNAPPGSPEAIGFMGLRGENATKAYPKFADDLKTSREQMRGQLQNPMQQLEFDKQTRRQLQFLMTRAGNHYDQQYDTFQTQTNQAGATLAEQQQERSVGDDAAFNDAVAAQMRYEYRQLQAQGLAGDDNAVWAMQQRVRSEAVDRQLKVYIGRNTTESLGNAARILDQQSGPGGALSAADAAKYRTVLSEYKVAAAIERARSSGGGGGAARATDLVPYTPSSDMLSGTGLSADQYEIFRSHVAARESNRYDQPPNGDAHGSQNLLEGQTVKGFMGRYQMGADEIRETAARFGVSAPTQQQFLGDPALQERFFENYTLDHHNSLMAQSEQYRNAPPTEKAALLMGAHLGGVQGVQNYLAGRGNAADSNGTTVGDYVTSMRQAMARGTTPAAPGAAPPAGASIPPQAQVFPSNNQIEVWGDSLGDGLNDLLRTPGHTRSGAPTGDIMREIKIQPETHWAGKTVVLSSGSNGPKMSEVRETIEYLQAHQANVVLVGYGTKGQLPQRNAELHQMAGEFKVPIVDAESLGSDGVHPTIRGYDSMAAKIRSIHTQFGASTPPPPTVPEGTIIYGPNGQQQKNVGGKLVDVTPRTPPPEM